MTLAFHDPPEKICDSYPNDTGNTDEKGGCEYVGAVQWTRFGEFTSNRWDKEEIHGITCNKKK